MRSARINSWGLKKPGMGYRINPNHPLAQGMTDYLPFNDGGGFITHSSIGANGAITGAVWTDTGAFNGPALSFASATDQVAQGSTPLTATGSILVWFLPNWAQTDSADHVFFDARTSGSSIFCLQKYLDNTLYCGWYNSAESRVVVGSGSYTMNQGYWNQMVLTWASGTGSTLYLNGAQIGTAGSPNTFTTGNRFWGQYNIAVNITGVNMNGKIDHGAIWNRALILGEVLELYQHPFAFFQPQGGWRGLNTTAAPPAFNPGWAYGATSGVLGSGVF